MIAVVDYGAGNLTSVLHALVSVGAEARLVREASAVSKASAIVIPGVGHFAATAGIGEDSRAEIRAAIDRGTPTLGICLGMQWLFEGSDESPNERGLGIFEGRCRALDGDVKLPHVGWNTLTGTGRRSRLLDGVVDPAWAYFTHTFAAPVGSDASMTADYGRPFAATVEHGSVFGCQWHPEKSGAVGRQVLRNFVAIAEGRG